MLENIGVSKFRRLNLGDEIRKFQGWIFQTGQTGGNG